MAKMKTKGPWTALSGIGSNLYFDNRDIQLEKLSELETLIT